MRLAGNWLFAAVSLGMAVLFPLSPAAIAAETLSSGQFAGRGGHETSGGVSIVKDGEVMKVVFASNFKLDGAPDPKVAFGNNGYVKGTIIAKLKKIKGAQTYTIPKWLDLAKYNEVWIWCQRFDSPIGRAKLNK